MYRRLKWLVRRCYRHRQIAGRENYLKLVIRPPQRKIMLVFYSKPPQEARKALRLYNFRWSRKRRHWHAYLNNGRLEQVGKLCRRLYCDNFNNPGKRK